MTAVLRSVTVRWDDVTRFVSVTMSGGREASTSRMVGYHLRRDADGDLPDTPRPRNTRVAARLVGADGALPSTSAYGQDLGTLVATLEQLRRRYSSRPEVTPPPPPNPGADHVAAAADLDPDDARVLVAAEHEYLSRCGVVDPPDAWQVYPPSVPVPAGRASDGSPVVDVDWLARDLAARLELPVERIVAGLDALDAYHR